jgi:hypothetical protein
MAMNQERKSLGRALLSSPLAMVLSVAMLVVFGMALASYIRRGGFWSPEVEARVLNEQTARGQPGRDVESRGRKFAFQGEVYDQAEQIRQSGALAIGATLLAAHRSLEGRQVQTVESLISGVVESDLLPPGLVNDVARKSVNSDYAVFYIRYRAEPLGVEVVSIGRRIEDGGVAIVVRLPDDGFSENALTYYMISKEGLQVPGAFTPAAQLIASGWRPETFKATALSPQERESAEEWLGTKSAGRK